MYKVIRDFMDLEDHKHIYRVGDIFPRNAKISIDAERYAELSSNRNKTGAPVIEYDPVEVPEKPSEGVHKDAEVNITGTRKKSSSRRKEK